jgi:TolB-like protein/DNA-binding SARP family transcriptional activator
MAMNEPSALGNGERARWVLRLLGGFELSVLPAGEKVTGLGKRERVLLAYLALNPKGREQRRKLTALLWGDSADETTLENLRNCLYGLRKSLGDTEHRVIASDGEDIVLGQSAFEVDALTFHRLAAQAGRAELEQAASLYAGGLLDGLDIESEEFESWRRAESMRFRDQAVDVLNRLMAQHAESGETDRAIETGKRLLTLDPLHESSVRRLMRLHAQTGRRSTAIQLYRTLSDRLKADLGAQPEAETRALFEDISRGDEQPIASTPKAVSTSASPSAGYPPKSSPPAPMPAVHEAFGGRRNWIIAGAIAATMAIVLAYLLIPSSPPQPVRAGAIAVAVLPFDNLSSDPEQQFFSDGITEEITSALARIPDLSVVARTSAFEFKDQNRNIQEIARALNATHLIEGSVRKAGDQVRITAQLIRGDTGLHIWTATYERNLTDIFAIQEEIARAVASSLSVPLGLKPGESLVSNRGIDPESYQQYLRARALFLARGEARLEQAAAMLEQVVARNPDYAPAWALLAWDYQVMPVFHPARRGRSTEESRRVVDELLRKSEAAAQRAVQLDPNSADAHAAVGFLHFVRGKLLLAEDKYRQARALDPSNGRMGLLLAEVGRPKEALAVVQQLLAVEPFVPLYNRTNAQWLWLEGQNDAAIAILRALPPGVNNGLNDLAMIYASLGRYAEAAELTEAVSADAARLLRTAPANAAAPQSLPDLGVLGWVYLYVGAPERALETYERDIQDGYSGGTNLPLIWHASFAPVRKTERFKAYVRARGLLEYWRERGWPEFCRPTGTDDFTCE